MKNNSICIAVYALLGLGFALSVGLPPSIAAAAAVGGGLLGICVMLDPFRAYIVGWVTFWVTVSLAITNYVFGFGLGLMTVFAAATLVVSAVVGYVLPTVVFAGLVGHRYEDEIRYG